MEPLRCPACKGTAVLPNSMNGRPEVCPICSGQGAVEDYLPLPYFYIIDETIAANGNAIAALNIADRDFEWIWNIASRTDNRLTVEFEDASGRRFQNKAVKIDNAFGTAQNPFPVGLTGGVVLPGRTSLSYKLVESSAASNVVQLALVGFERYPRLRA